jgi:hypothetical protein
VVRAPRGYGNWIETSSIRSSHWSVYRECGKHQHPQFSWGPVLIVVTRENFLVDVSFIVGIKHSKARDSPMADAIMLIFVPIICQ